MHLALDLSKVSCCAPRIHHFSSFLTPVTIKYMTCKVTFCFWDAPLNHQTHLLQRLHYTLYRDRSEVLFAASSLNNWLGYVWRWVVLSGCSGRVWRVWSRMGNTLSNTSKSQILSMVENKLYNTVVCEILLLKCIWPKKLPSVTLIKIIPHCLKLWTFSVIFHTSTLTDLDTRGCHPVWNSKSQRLSYRCSVASGILWDIFMMHNLWSERTIVAAWMCLALNV